MLFALELAELYQLGYFLVFFFFWHHTYENYDNVIQVKTTIKLQVFQLGLIP